MYLELCDQQHISIVTWSCSYILTILLILNAECVL